MTQPVTSHNSPKTGILEEIFAMDFTRGFRNLGIIVSLAYLFTRFSPPAANAEYLDDHPFDQALYLLVLVVWMAGHCLMALGFRLIVKWGLWLIGFVFIVRACVAVGAELWLMAFLAALVLALAFSSYVICVLLDRARGGSGRLRVDGLSQKPNSAVSASTCCLNKTNPGSSR